MSFKGPLLLTTACLLIVSSLGQDSAPVTRTMFVTALLSGYDSAVTPTFDKNYATNVNVSLYVNGINSVNEQHMDFSVNMYLMQTWNDERLSFGSLIGTHMLELDSKIISKFWVPDLYFVNEKSSDFHDVTVPNRLLHLYADGTVVYKTRLTVTATCEMDLHDFPFDKQNCSLYIKSFGYSNHSLQLMWPDDNALSHNLNLKMSQFTLMDMKNRECHDVPTNSSVYRAEPLFSCLAVDFILHRSVGFYTIQIYIPSVLIVVLSWVSFVLDVAAVPARISLGILTVLTMTNMKSIAISSLPKVSYIKAIDVWMAACLSFVFASLLEFALVNAFSRREREPSDNGFKPETVPLKNIDGTFDGPTTVAVGRRNRKIQGNWAAKLDRLSIILFPLSFLAFTFIYLLIYCI